MLDSIASYKLVFRILAGVGFVLSTFQMWKLRHANSVRRQLQSLLLLSSILVSLRALEPPYPLPDERPYGIPLVVFFLCDTATTASLYCVALVFVRFLVVTAASPGQLAIRCDCVSNCESCAGGEHWFSREMMFHGTQLCRRHSPVCLLAQTPFSQSHSASRGSAA